MRLIIDDRMDKVLRKLKKSHTSGECAQKLNEQFGTQLTDQQVKGYCCRKKIYSGLGNGRFKKGNVPANKGKRISKELYEKCSKTMFKPGIKPANTLPVDTVIELEDGYLYKKIHDTPKARKKDNWAKLHYLVWEEQNGKVPDNHVLLFVDGNRRNINIDNLICVSRKVNLFLNKNRLRFKNKTEMQKACISYAQLNVKLNELKKEKKEND